MPRRSKKADGPKGRPVNYILIPPKDGDHEPEPYKLLGEVRQKWHEDLDGARIALAWRIRQKADKDGIMVLGRCVKVSDLNKEFAAYDFIIVLNREVWEDLDFTREKKIALLDHELCHASVSYDNESGERIVDERGRTCYRTRKHDIEEFEAVVVRHGTYKRDLERFAEALLKRRQPQMTLPGPDMETDNAVSPVPERDVTVSIAATREDGTEEVLLPPTPGKEFKAACERIASMTPEEKQALAEAELYQDAVRLVAGEGKGATTILQRRLRVSYARAASMIDRMEEEGIVGPADGAKARAVNYGKLPEWAKVATTPPTGAQPQEIAVQ